MHTRLIRTALAAAAAMMWITGCTSQASNVGMAKGKDDGGGMAATGFTAAAVGSYDSADTAVVMSVDQQNKAVVCMNMDAGRQYTLYYDGATNVCDKYGGPMTISQIGEGDIVDVTFLKGQRRLAGIQLSPQAWSYDKIQNYDLGGLNKTASIGSATYSLPDDAVVFSRGRRAEVMDIVAQDAITVKGVGHEIYSISVERGHGYIRLKNEQALVGGWIEVGNAVIREISEDMLLVVPEGSYQVRLSNNGADCIKDVTVERDKEVILDVGDLEIAQDRTGRILFSVTPEDATVKIDGSKADISSPVELAYGIHQVNLEAEGYDSLTKYIQVGSDYAQISFTMEKTKTSDDDNTVSANSADRTEDADEGDNNDQESDGTEDAVGAKTGNRVYIDAPKGAEVYVDGNYLGICPVSFNKVQGSHTVTLRRSGYVTKSYTIYLYNDGEDITYSFTELERQTGVSGNSSSVSDNSTSGGGSGNSTSGGSASDNNADSSASDNDAGGSASDND